MIPIAKPIMGGKEILAVEELLKSGRLSQGSKVKEFEDNFASYITADYAIATNSGTSALHVALLAAGIKEGDEVITSPFTFISTANSILFCNARPVFVDINEKTFNINPNLIVEKITPKTKAVLPVHLYGQPCDMEPIMDICEDHNLILIEDACQAHGAEYEGKKVGSLGVGCFSFYPTKNMTTGEGGIITTNDKKIAEKARMLRNHGQKEKYLHAMLGYNYRMTDIAAAIGICQLKKLDYFNNKRIQNAKFLTARIKKINGLVPPYVKPNVKHVFHQYTVKVKNRQDFLNYQEKKGVGYGIYYPIPIHKQPVFKEYNKIKLEKAEKASEEVISIPVHPGLSDKELKYIVEVVNAYDG